METIAAATIKALNACDVSEKAALARRACALWQTGELDFTFDQSPPDRPGRPEKPALVHPSDMPKRRKSGSLSNRQALLHAVCHIECNAIDLALDIVARFGADMPRSFTDDWMQVADDEARHFTMVNDRLVEMGSYYGALPAHDGLWESAQQTVADLPARLAIVPMVLEARGLDVTPAMRERFTKYGDQKSADILGIIYREEISHVAAGSRWFKYLANKSGRNGAQEKDWFREKVDQYFRGQLKPPFNVPARTKAEMPEDWYAPITDF